MKRGREAKSCLSVSAAHPRGQTDTYGQPGWGSTPTHTHMYTHMYTHIRTHMFKLVFFFQPQAFSSFSTWQVQAGFSFPLLKVKYSYIWLHADNVSTALKKYYKPLQSGNQHPPVKTLPPGLWVSYSWNGPVFILWNTEKEEMRENDKIRVWPSRCCGSTFHLWHGFKFKKCK